MARTKLTKQERERRARERTLGIKRVLAVIWTKFDHTRARRQQRQRDRNLKKPATFV